MVAVRKRCWLASQVQEQRLDLVREQNLQLVGNGIAECGIQRSFIPCLYTVIALQYACDQHVAEQADGLGSSQLAINAYDFENLPGCFKCLLKGCFLFFPQYRKLS